MAGSVTYYAQVKKLADPLLKYYRDDLLRHDRNDLRGYEGEFVHITREMGTHLIKLVPYEGYPKAGEIVPYLFGSAGRELILRGKDISHIVNPYSAKVKLILWGCKGKVSQIEAEKALEIVADYISGGLKLWAKERRTA